MKDQNPPSVAPRPGQAGEPTAAGFLVISLRPITVEVRGTVPPAAPSPDHSEELVPAQISHADDPTTSAILRIKSLPITVEVGGNVPASETPMFITTLGMSATGMTGIAFAAITAYGAASHVPAYALGWFLGLAGAELALAGAVIFRIARRDRSVHLHR